MPVSSTASIIVYQPIGFVESPIREPARPEVVRAVESRLALHPSFARAVARLETGQHLLVIYHLHRAEPWNDKWMPGLFTRRIASRPNPVGVTLTRIVAIQDATITVVGLDAIDGSPILDIKPYQPIFDAPPIPLEVCEK